MTQCQRYIIKKSADKHKIFLKNQVLVLFHINVSTYTYHNVVLSLKD